MSIRLEGLLKTYGGLPAVADFSLDVGPGELVVLLGPSGSGKSTVLRMIAGLVAVDGGRVLLHDRDVTQLPAQSRETGFVFQHYALFRHLTVAENVEFALSVRGVGRAERRRRAAELLELVGLGGLGRRLPRQLSGGQQQRVALARALAHRPKVLLLDEPFGALDARIRLDLRRGLHQIQRELGIPTLFVTHDQEEAFELADRIAVMALGRLVEVGPPRELYLRPQTEFVATFLGSANLLVGEATPGGVRLGPVDFPLVSRAAEEPVARRVQVLFRPEDVALAGEAEEMALPTLGVGTVESCAFAGPIERLRLRLPAFVGVRAIAPAARFGSGDFVVEASRSPHESRRLPLQPGERVRVAVRRLHALLHPGLRFLLVVDEAAALGAAIAGRLARQAHARLGILACGGGDPDTTLAAANAALGGAVVPTSARAERRPLAAAVAGEASREPADLVVLGAAPGAGTERVDALLGAGEHHVLLLRDEERPLPQRVLLAVQVGEPGKADVAFTGRLFRHLGATITVLTVQPETSASAELDAARRFLDSAVRTLAPLGLHARGRLRQGPVEREVLAELAAGHDLLAIGVPAPRSGGAPHLGSVAGRLLEASGALPVLVVRGEEEAT